MALKIPNPSPSKAEAKVVKIDPPWKRVIFFILGLVFFPLTAVVLGIILGVFWRLFLLGWGFGVTIF